MSVFGDRPKPGDILTARFLNELIDALLERVSVTGATVHRAGRSVAVHVDSRGRGAGTNTWIGAIQTPDNDYSDARYYVKKASIRYDPNEGYTLTVPDDAKTVTAVNLSEWGLGADGKGTHSLTNWPVYATRHTRYVLVHEIDGAYVFTEPPGVYTDEAYEYDVRTINSSGCPTVGYWYGGVRLIDAKYEEPPRE